MVLRHPPEPPCAAHSRERTFRSCHRVSRTEAPRTRRRRYGRQGRRPARTRMRAWPAACPNRSFTFLRPSRSEDTTIAGRSIALPRQAATSSSHARRLPLPVGRRRAPVVPRGHARQPVLASCAWVMELDCMWLPPMFQCRLEPFCHGQKARGWRPTDWLGVQDVGSAKRR